MSNQPLIQYGAGKVAKDISDMRVRLSLVASSILSIPITIPNPVLTSGDGVFIKHTTTPYTVTVPAGNGLSLIDLNFHNTGPATSQFYGVKIQTEADVVDTAAGIAVFNSGRADSIYINAAGKSGNASNNTTTGIGIDINKEIASSSERASANSSQQGIQIFDWSTTNQGIGGPRAVLLQKQGNRNTDHLLMSLVANRKAVQFVVKTGDAGYDGGQSLITVSDETTPADWWQIRADATQIYNKDGAGIQWITPGSKTAYIMASTNDLKLKSGGTGIRFVNQADTDFGILMQDNLDVILGLAGNTSNTHGFPHMPAAAGIPAGSPATYAGWQPFTFDTTNNDFYVFNAGWKKVGSVNGITGTGSTNQLAIFTGTTTVGGTAPSSSPGAASAILMSAPTTGLLTLAALTVSAVASGYAGKFNVPSGDYGFTAFQVNGVDKDYVQWNINDAGAAAGTAMIVNNAQGKLHLWDSTTTGIEISGGSANFVNQANFNKVGSNFRFKGAGTDAGDGGVFATGGGDKYFANWNADQGIKLPAAGGTETIGIFKVNDATDSTSTTTGALTTPGGIGVAKNGTFGGILRGEVLEWISDRIENYTVNDDIGTVAVNYRGYNAGTTKFRDFKVFDGKETVLINVDGSASSISFAVNNLGFYGHSPVALQTGVAVTAAGIHAALVNLGLITA